MSRQTKTPRQRAEEQLAVSKRAVERLASKKNALEHDLREVDHELTDAVRRRDYLAQHPDLQHHTNPTGDTTA